ncbi:Hypothetical protein R9X50_00392100 [Acrodontium crateriforme]|uniref:GPI-anchored cell wall organization protein Ecm33 n=1 Tax=Acrodontium crateriforme TaxID=150365 RepID=A0AAQ3R4N0_9PEZI|nr:Hypothetical protein R9X50_00392100 [Acrodontium crateriforme]
MSLKYIVPVMAVAGRAIAASSCSASTTTLHSQADATALSACQTFTGTVALATDAAGSIDISGVEEITGSLIGNNVTGLTTLSADNLQKIGDTFSLQACTILSGLTFPALVNVAKIDWAYLSALQELSFDQGVQMAKSVSIQTTGLTTLTGINLQEVDTMVIANNHFLNDVTMQLGNVTDHFSCQANAQNFSIAFPNLIWANQLEINNVSSIDLPSLMYVNESAYFTANYFQTLSAANLTSVGESLSFVANSDLTNVTMPLLTSITGGLTVANNTDLQKVNGFTSLKTIGGAFDFFGNFTDVELPAITEVQGAFNLQSTGDISKACDHFQSIAGSSSVIRGTFTCHYNDASAGGIGSGSTGVQNGGDGSSTTSSAAAVPMLIPGATGVLGVLLAMLGML